MGYVTFDDVQARMRQFPLDSTTRPTRADAETFLNEAEAEVDLSLANAGYVTPVTGTKSRLIVRGMVIALTIAMILEARAMAVGGAGVRESAENARKLYETRIKNLVDQEHPLELSDAVHNDQELLKPAMFIGGLLYDDDGDDIEPGFTMDQKF